MKLAISIGDLAGIGPEVVLKALKRPVGGDVELVIFGDFEALRRENDLLEDEGLSADAFDWRFEPISSAERTPEEGSVGVIDVAPDVDLTEIEKGTPDARCAEVQKAAFEMAVEVTQSEVCDAVVTAPWNKSLFELIGEPVVGHTDVLDDLFPTSRAEMMLAGPRLRVALVTTHVPLRRVPDRLTSGRLRTVIRTTIGGLRQRFGIARPTIAVCGLNPHAGEGGAMGGEEADIIEPTLDTLRSELEEGTELLGPLPPDTLFARYRDDGAPHDAVVCMYHDQGLIPLKLAHFGESANITLGLPIVRTSVDHGTAYDIAGRALADPGSMRYAIELAADIVRRG